ncbi:MAG TPA: hypothetical protein VF930_02790 [Stellaceae bacterium]
MTGRLVLALVLAGAVGGIAPAPARADDERGRDRHERFDRERAARDEWRYHHRRPVYVAPPPAYVYAPPPVVYAPPPPAGINLIFPLNIR